MRGKLNIKVVSKTPFYFVSYNSEDAKRVNPCAKYLVSHGIPLWCDNGIPYGNEWETAITQQIKQAKGIILFFTNGCLQKKESYVRKEYEIAKFHKKNVLVVYLDEASNIKIPDWSLSWFLDLKRIQSVHLNTFSNQNEMLQVLLDQLAEPKKVEEVKAKPVLVADAHLLSCFANRIEKLAGEGEIRISKETLIACLPPRYLVAVDILDTVSGYQAIRHTVGPLGDKDAKTVLKKLNERFNSKVRMTPSKKRKIFEIELPRAKIPAVSFKPICSHLFSYEKGLYLPVGFRFGGDAAYSDFTAYQHLFLIGEQSTGKSYYLRTLALSLLMQSQRCRVRLHIFDATKSKIFRGFKDSGDNIIFQLDSPENVQKSFDFLRGKIKEISKMSAREYKRHAHIYDVILIDDFEAFVKTYRSLGKKYLKFADESKEAEIRFIIASRDIKGKQIRKNIDRNGKIIFSVPSSLAGKLQVEGLMPLLASYDFLGGFPDFKTKEMERYCPAYLSDDEVHNCLAYLFKK